MNYTLSHIARIIDAEGILRSDPAIGQLLYDSRKIYSPGDSLFFALKSTGHRFIADAYKKGVRSFVISETVEENQFPEAEFLKVYDCLAALQALTAYHREQFSIPVIGITGSNGKTIVKEWLSQLLQEDFNIVRSPKSYNSQIGVPLSIWQMNEQHTLALIEAGISEQGEMIRLERIIRPTIGILTNIGEAHSEGFTDTENKFREKLVLFKNCQQLIAREIDIEGRRDVLDMLGDKLRVFTWGQSEKCDFIVREIEKKDQSTTITFEGHRITIPFTDDAAIENAITCYCVLQALGIDPVTITERMLLLQPVNMRLELKKGINHCAIINDSYSADINSLEIALDFLDQQSAGTTKTVILSDFLQSSAPDHELYGELLEKLEKHGIKRLIAIGERIGAVVQATGTMSVELYPSTDQFISGFLSSHFKEETILIKGARVFAFEKIVQLLEQKAHQTVLEINLAAIVHNLKEYRKLLRPATKIMAMVKAFAYGSGGAEIAGILQYHHIDYLGVAYADEGIDLRKAGIRLPVMVMNPEESAFEKIVENNLEPELYSFGMLQSFNAFLLQEGIEQYPVHIEIETGMNRLGFAVNEIERTGELIRGSALRVQSVFTHLAASEEKSQDEFTREQSRLFEKAVERLQEIIGYPFLRHIANSAAVARHPELQMDMVRLGIGLYGIDSAGSGKLNLQTVATLRSTVAQVKQIKAGETVSYNRKGIAEKDLLIATIRIGYADGYPRRLGNGKASVWIKGKMAPIIGTVCMDMFMVDITSIPLVNEGDEVIIFGTQLPVQQLADLAGTIPYEIMTGISQRVKRVYFEE